VKNILNYKEEESEEEIKIFCDLVEIFYIAFYSVGITLGMEKFIASFNDHLKIYQIISKESKRLIDLWKESVDKIYRDMEESVRINPKV